jgi:peptidoglycan/xylan/chitin deacetylase (PgdA/CDA1 family)
MKSRSKSAKRPAAKAAVAQMPRPKMPAATENDFYPRQPIVNRPAFSWPNGADMAFGVVVSLEHYELQPPADAFVPSNLPGGMGRAPYPDVRSTSQRAYGNRVGIFRVMDVLTRHGIKATAAVDVWTAENCPAVVSKLEELDWEVAGHGHAVNQVISSRMDRATERKYIQSAARTLEKVFGRRPAGWHGPEYGESERTPGLLAELGFQYVIDWPNDEQPYRMQTEGGPLISVPVAVDLDDVFSYWQRRIWMDRWERAVIEAVDTLQQDGRTKGGRMMLLNLHPWMIGQPWRIASLEAVIANIASRKGIWLATAGEIAAWAEAQLPPTA